MIPDLLINILALIMTLGILVTIHEFGHFWVARRCGVKVLRFSVGFGKPFKSWYGRDGVEYAIAPIPLGGYVKMLGQEDVGVTDLNDVPNENRHQSFAFKPLPQRMAIVAAGPIANFILAAVVFWIIYISYGVSGIAPVVHSVVEDSAAEVAGLRAGDEILAVDGEETIIWQQVTMQLLSRLGDTGDVELSIKPRNSETTQMLFIPLNNWLSREEAPDPLTDLGIIQWDIPPVIAGVLSNGRAEVGGLLEGDEILAVDGFAVRGWRHWVSLVRSSPELDMQVAVQRGDRVVDLVLRPESTLQEDGSVAGAIGASVRDTTLGEIIPVELRREINYNLLTAIKPALQETWDKSVFVLESIKKMVVGAISVKNISGPITIAQIAGETATYSPEVYLGFLAILSISLGVLNLLPIPVLDGGHLLYFIIEGIIRKPVPLRLQELGLQLGLLVISGIMVLAIYNDVTRLL